MARSDKIAIPCTKCKSPLKVHVKGGRVVDDNLKPFDGHFLKECKVCGRHTSIAEGTQVRGRPEYTVVVA